MTLSVVIIAFNSEQYILNCIKSYLDQKTGHEIEIIVVDNASKDCTVQIVSENFPGVKIIANTENVGYGAAINQALDISSGEYFAVSNDDLVADEQWFEKCLSVMDSNSRCGLVASKVLYMDDPSVINSTGVLLYKDMTAVNRGLDELDVGQYDRVEEVFGAYGAVMLFRKSAMEQTGRFEEDYWLFREEDEYTWRMRLQGYKVLYCPGARVLHKRSAHTTLYSPLKLYYSERNRIWNSVKFLPAHRIITCQLYAVWRLLHHAFGLFSKKQNSLKKNTAVKKLKVSKIVFTIMKAWFDAFWGIRPVLRKRRKINTCSVIGFRQRLEWIKTYSACIQDLLK